MSKTFTIALAIASFAAIAAVAPAHAATRTVDIHAQLFADRCFEQGGAFSQANPTFACETPDTVIVCSFLSLNQANCEWPGIEGQVVVNRIIGMQDAVAYGGSGGSVVKGGGGGFKLPDLPLKWK